jgi:hypothetical protein
MNAVSHLGSSLLLKFLNQFSLWKAGHPIR